MTSKRLIRITTPLLVLIALYFLGPQPETPEYDSTLPNVPGAAALDNYVAGMERLHRIKPDNKARIIWRDSTKTKTEFSIVYLHGFSASQREGGPVHTRLAKEFNCNLYLSRIADHGIDTTEALLYFTAERAWRSAQEALAIGSQLGEKVIVMSTSTGGTLALKLAATYPEKVHALVNLSPNIEINNPAAFLLNDPWGLHIARMVMGGKYRVTGASEDRSQYWNGKYRLESVVQLQELVESTMTDETFAAIHQPSLTLYYYKDEDHQDPEVRVEAMLEMNKKLATPDDMKSAIAIPEAGAHVIGSDLVSKDYESVEREIRFFFINKLGMQPNATASDKGPIAWHTRNRE